MATPPFDQKRLPPWSGPTGTVDLPKMYPSEYPYASASNPNLFPPVCLRSHWDPEQIIRRTLPSQQIAAPLEPRPWTRVCMSYTTTQDFEDAPRPHDSMTFPNGGSTYPTSRYREAIDHESELKGLDRPLGTCEKDQYSVPTSGTMYVPNQTFSRTRAPNDRFIEELSFPMACMRAEDYDCRANTQAAAASRSPLAFNNATKQDRYSIKRPDLVKRIPTLTQTSTLPIKTSY